MKTISQTNEGEDNIQHILKKEYITDHKPRATLRVAFFAAFGVYDPIMGLASALLFWVLFDQLLNWMRYLPFWYLGTVAKTDIFFSKRKWLYISIKISSLILSLLLFLI